MYTYKTIIFDMDGTLFKTDTIFVAALNEVCAARGWEPWDKSEILKLIGEPMTKICRLIFGESLMDEEVEQIRSEVRAAEGEFLAETGSLYDGVLSMLDKLWGEGYTLCICSNGSKQYVDTILEAFGLTDRFSIIKSRVEGVSKSQLIKQILDEYNSCSAVVVGDRAIDFEAANSTGCLSIGAKYGYGCAECDKADFAVNSPMEIYYVVKKINNLYKKLSQSIVEIYKKDKPLIVGINGVDTSGKTVFAKELDNYLTKAGFKVQTINLDDFHNTSSIRSKGTDPVTAYINNAFDLQRLEKEILEPIALENELHSELLLLDLHTDEYTVRKRFEVDKYTIVLVEGSLLYREPIDKYFDFRLYLDISFEEVLKRACIRDGYLFGDSVIERYKQKYIPVQKAYINEYFPKDRSNMVINNEDFNNPEIASVKEHIDQ